MTPGAGVGPALLLLLAWGLWASASLRSIARWQSGAAQSIVHRRSPPALSPRLLVIRTPTTAPLPHSSVARAAGGPLAVFAGPTPAAASLLQFLPVLAVLGVTVAALLVGCGRARWPQRSPKVVPNRSSIDSQPVVFVVGTTGSGKSRLAVDFALRLKTAAGMECEIVNADVMQMFQGLDIITNKASPEEQCGVPHHLLACLPPDTTDFHVTKFRDLAVPLITDIGARGRLPIVVGGTHYYVESLLFDTLITSDPPSAIPVATDPNSQPFRWEALSEASDPQEVAAAFAELQAVDPAMAQQLHPNNARKIKRSLQVFHETGRPHSELLAAQTKYQLRYPRHLLLCLDADRDTLNARLDRRVDGMLTRGLLREISEFSALHRDLGLDAADSTANEPESPSGPDFTRGILQSIGLKEFQPFLARTGSASPTDPADEAVLSQCVAGLKAHTRRYANRQRQWVRNRFAVHDHLNLFQLDSTGVAEAPHGATLWETQVLDPAIWLVRDFLAGHDVRALHAALLAPRTAKREAPDGGAEAGAWFHCADCVRDIHGAAQWAAHLKSRAHRRQREWLAKKDEVEMYRQRRLAANSGRPGSTDSIPSASALITPGTPPEILLPTAPT